MENPEAFTVNDFCRKFRIAIFYDEGETAAAGSQSRQKTVVLKSDAETDRILPSLDLSATA
jgi:hypothetical protein